MHQNYFTHRQQIKSNIHWILKIVSLLIFLVESPGDLGAAEPVVSNRAPAPGEVNYSPQEGETVKVTPPGFVWLPEEGAVSYILQCSIDREFRHKHYEKKDITLNIHCPPAPFTPGTWFWRYTYVTKDGQRAQWSRTRSFTIDKDAVSFPQPTLNDLLTRLPEEHPKLFLRPEEVQSFREKLETQYKKIWERFLVSIDEMMETPITTDEPPPYPSGGFRSRSKEDIDLWRANRRIVSNAVDCAANLAFAYLLTGEERYGERAREWILAVTAWPPDGATSYRYNDECAMPILSRLPRAYTWAYNALSDEDREKIIASMTARGREVYQHLREHNHTVRPYESHNNRAWHFMGETAIAFIDDIPEAEQWLQYAMDIFFNVYPVWSDDDGGWHEGAAYWRSYIGRITWWMDILKAGFDIDGYKKPYFSKAGEFPFYVNPIGSIHGGFGDSADVSAAADNVSLMNTLARQAGNEYWLWYAREAAETKTIERPNYGDLLRLRLPVIESKIPYDLPRSKIFHGVGIASLHAILESVSNDVHLLFKSSPFGSQSHGFNAQNSFLLSVYGLPVLTWAGHRDWHGSEHHTKWMWETLSDNCITVNGQGQKKHHASATGKIISEYLGETMDYVAGEAADAYEGRLDQFTRHIFFVKPDIFILVDELKAPEPSLFQFHLHANEMFSIGNQFEIEAKNAESAARIAFVTPADIKITQNAGCVPPSIGFDQEQWNLKAETTEKRKEAVFITLIKAHKTGKPPQILIRSFQKDSATVYGMPVNNRVLGFVYNPTGEDFNISGVKSDARFLLISENQLRKRETEILAIQAQRLEIGEKTLLKSEIPQNFFLSKEETKEFINKE